MKMRSSLFAWIPAVLALGCATDVLGYVAAEKWATGTAIKMDLQLTADPAPKISVTLTDGSLTWNHSAKKALEAWNKNIAKVQFTSAFDASFTPRFGDKKNSSHFARRDLDGWLFDEDTLAVTFLDFDSKGYIIETDVTFNAGTTWDSYPGKVKTKNDFYRVALHEYGHVLGLDHPDENGQRLDAVMNSIIGDDDTLKSDDILGAQSLYGKRTDDTPPPAVDSPVLTIVSASSKKNTGATVAAKFNPKGKSGVYYFAYGTVGSKKFNSKTPAVYFNASSKNTSVKRAVTGLLPNTSYQYRLVVETEDATYTSKSSTFKTLKPEAKVNTVSSLKNTSATLRGSANPKGAGGKYLFQYGTTPNGWQYSTPTKTLATSSSAIGVTAPITKLKKKTTYYYRVKVIVNKKSFYSPSATFKTKA